ncbi:MAG: T9SS type A sorting domain-containing protein [Candidatus Kapabacteria bacterium]|jgi:hypothetical protein|nr:T9SS type A sorting domain-containing protein [Candidatus Kapabacteria bacterium]
MRIRFVFFFVLLLLSASADILAQRLSRNDTARSSRGRDFYMVFLPNFHEESRDSANTRDSLFIFVTCDKPTSGRITYRNRLGREFSRGFSITDPTQIFTFAMNYGDIELEAFNITQRLNPVAQSEQIAQQYVRIEANDEVTVYALNQARFTSDAHLVLPVPALGRDHVIMSYFSDGSGLPFVNNPGNDTPSQFAVVAVEDNTEVTIQPTVPTFPSQSTTTQTVRLQRGQSYLLQADTRIGNGRGDLTGSRVKATKPIAVFGSHQRALLPIQFRSFLTSRDHLVEQMPPVETWGKSVFLVPHAQPSFQADIGTDVYRVLAAYDNTIVQLNGQPLDTLNAGEFYEAPLNREGWITANEQVLVAQFKKTGTPSGIPGGVGSQVGDPFMMVIPTVEQYDKGYRFINAQVRDVGAAGMQSFTEHYVTIVVHANGVNSMEFDGRPIPTNSFRPIVNSGYVFGNFRVSGGVHTARGDSAFGIYVYGYGQANSYGYIGGGKLRVIAPDRDPSQIVLLRECAAVSGTALDTLITDSRLGSVVLTPTTLANVRLSVEQFIPRADSSRYADSIRFRAELINPFQDGGFSVVARDSVGFVTRLNVPVYGFTVGYATQNIVALSNTMLSAQGGTGAPAQLQFQLPTGRFRNFPFVITNYGATAQTISQIRFSLGTRNLQIVGTTLPIVIASGASETLQISYFAAQDGIISDTLRVTSTCGNRIVAVLNIESRTDRTPPGSSATPDACGQRVALDFTEPDGFAAGIFSVTPQMLVNCTVRTDSIGARLTRTLVSVINPRLDASYTIQVRDSSGNVTTVQNVIPGFTVALVGDRTSVGNFGETSVVGTTNCITVQYRNSGSQPFVYARLAPQGNTTFSLPVSQLPITIAPGAMQRITLCFAPSEVRDFRDTLILGGNCLGDTLVLRGTGIAPNFLGDSRCDVPVRLRIVSTPSRLAVVNTAPQPASDIANLKIMVSEAAQIRISIMNAQGMMQTENAFVGEISEGETEIPLSTAHLPTGVYFCTIQAGTKQVVRQIVVVR